MLEAIGARTIPICLVEVAVEPKRQEIVYPSFEIFWIRAKTLAVFEARTSVLEAMPAVCVYPPDTVDNSKPTVVVLATLVVDV